MELREYLFRERMTVTEFAKKIDYDRNHINLMVTGTRTPSPNLAEVISQATGGKVTEKDFGALVGKRARRRKKDKK